MSTRQVLLLGIMLNEKGRMLKPHISTGQILFLGRFFNDTGKTIKQNTSTGYAFWSGMVPINKSLIDKFLAGKTHNVGTSSDRT